MNKLTYDLIYMAFIGLVYLGGYIYDLEYTRIAVIANIVVFIILIMRVSIKNNTKLWIFVMVFPVFNFLDIFYKHTLSWFMPIPQIYIFIFVLVGYLILFFWIISHQIEDKKTLQTHIDDKQDLQNVGDFPIYVNKEIMIPEMSRYTHTQVIGTTGSGKTRFIFYPSIFQDIRNKAGVFIFDIKSNMREKIETAVISAGRDLEYSYFNLGDMKSMKYNPLSGDNPGEIANRVFTALYYDMNRSEQFYIDVAKRFLPAVIGVLKKKWDIITFEDLYWMTVNPKKYLQPICNEMPDDINAKFLLDFMKMKAEELQRNLMGLVNKLAQFVTPEWAPQINTLEPEIDIGKILSNGNILLFQANSGVYQQEYKPLSILLMMHIQTEISKRYSTKREKLKPFFIYLDEFDKIVYPGFSELINKAREAKIGLIFGHQSLGDIQQYGESLKNQILTNARNKIVLKVEDPETADYFSRAFGTKTIERKVSSYNSDGQLSGQTDRQEEEFNIHPNKLKFLRLGEACVKIEDGDKGRSFINIINLVDMNVRKKQNNLYVPKRKETDNRTTNVNLDEKKGADVIGKSVSPTLKWKHIKANAKKEQEEENSEETKQNETG